MTSLGNTQGERLTGMNDSHSQVHVIFGPTGSGKTALSLRLAKELDGEIISTDSRQIYTGLDIGTGKILPHEMEGIPHYGLNLISPQETYNAALFGEYAREKITDIQSRGKTAILCGGTGLYIDSTIYSLSLPPFESDQNFQQELEDFRQLYGNLALWEKLAAIDPGYAREIHPNSYPYVCRAIEVKIRTGKSKKDFRTERKSLYNTKWHWTFDGDRESLYNRINARVEQMFVDGWVEEVQNLLLSGYTKESPGMKTIGYEEICSFLSKERFNSLEEVIEKVQQHNRNYAKRQITWFHRKKD